MRQIFRCILGFHQFKTIMFWSEGYLGHKGSEYRMSCTSCNCEYWTDSPPETDLIPKLIKEINI
jgi:hypothetical protein